MSLAIVLRVGVSIGHQVTLSGELLSIHRGFRGVEMVCIHV